MKLALKALRGHGVLRDSDQDVQQGQSEFGYK